MDKVPKEFSDITIVVNGTKYRLHKVILSKIPFFNKLFTSGLKESYENEIALDVDKKAFKEIIGNLYYNFFTEPEVVDNYDYSTIETMLYLGMDEYLKDKSINLGNSLNELLDEYREDYDKGDFLINFPEVLERLIFLNNYLGIKTTSEIPTEVIQLIEEQYKYYPLTAIHLSATEYAHHPYWKISDISKIYHQHYEDRGEKTNEEMLQSYIKNYMDVY